MLSRRKKSWSGSGRQRRSKSMKLINMEMRSMRRSLF